MKQIDSDERVSQKKTSKRNLYIMVVILVITSIFFKIINENDFEQTSILFIGIPAFITILLIKYTSTPQSIYGVVFRVITIFLLICAIFLGEGTVCIIFMAPIFYGVGALIALIFNLLKRYSKKKLYSFGLIPILLSVAQPNELFSEPTLQTVETSIIVDKPVKFEAFNNSPDFLKEYPNFFKLGFPKPIQIQGEGIQVGSTREIQFLSSTKGVGILNLKISDHQKNEITFSPISDDTHIDHWLTWNKMNVQLVELPNNQTEIKWTTSYYCDLGPSWYFEPLENVAINIMNKHLLNAYFTR